MVDKCEDPDLVAAQVGSGLQNAEVGSGWKTEPGLVGWFGLGASATTPRGTCRWGLPPVSVLSSITAIASDGVDLPQYVPAMMDPILGDYARNNPDARCVAY